MSSRAKTNEQERALLSQIDEVLSAPRDGEPSPAEYRIQAAVEAHETRLACDFGSGSLHGLIVDALADGITCLRRLVETSDDAGEPVDQEDGTDDDELDEPAELDPEEVRAFLARVSASAIADHATEFATADAESLPECLLDAIESLGNSEDFEYFASCVVGPITELGGCDSSSFGGMTSGSIYVSAISRNGTYAVFESGEDAFSAYDLNGPFEQTDDNMRNTRLSIAADFGGLGPGVWIAGDDDIDDDVLRDLTLESSEWGDMWWMACERHDLALFTEDHVEPFAVATGVSGEEAQRRIAELVNEDPFPQSDAEREVLWDIWKQIRP